MKLNTSKRKKFRVSNKVKKVASIGRFRLSISRSSKNISAQIIDDNMNVTLKVLSADNIEDIAIYKTFEEAEYKLIEYLKKIIAWQF